LQFLKKTLIENVVIWNDKIEKRKVYLLQQKIPAFTDQDLQLKTFSLVERTGIPA